MSLEGQESRRSNSRTRRLSPSSIMSEEDTSNPGLIQCLGTDGLRPPRTAVIRTKTRCINTNQTTGLKLTEQCIKNLSMMSSVRQQLVTRKECMKMGSARPIPSRGLRDGNSHGIRHFQGLIHSKIRDLALEIEKLHWASNDAQQEYINSLTYETKAKELASEITNFQETLADLNLAFDYVNRIGDIKELEQEVRELEELNVSERRRIEGIFDERKVKEQFIHQIDYNERFKKIINNSHPDKPEGKEQYVYLNNRLSESLKAVEFWEKQIKRYKEVKDMITQKLKTKLPFIDDIISQEKKMLSLKRKCNENSTLRLNVEREIILETVKQDKSEITGMECNLKSLTNQINNLQEVIDYLKSSEDEISCTKETIDVYLSSFDTKKNDEIKELNLLNLEILRYLSDLEIKFSLIPTANDYLNLHENKTGEAEFSDSIDFKKEHHKTFNYLKKIELMEFYHTKYCKHIDEKSVELKDDLKEYNRQTKMNDKYKTQENMLTKQILQLEEDTTINLDEQQKAEAQLKTVEKEISENEKHKQLVTLETKCSCLEEDIMSMNQTINEMKTTTTHFLDIRAKTINLMGLINSELINHYEQEDRFLNHCSTKVLFK
ncbi:intraflagellar transport protein 74 homolog [Halyomorpha halys]|uniref:intraflagellar transport protein 74 homolog n=1 Tax=Halyomorpha halys TaxID=286706 RepID=UPI0006D4FCE8|nr:intraflagellar transport protein 74 homolog [Halyomorpha halys]